MTNQTGIITIEQATKEIAVSVPVRDAVIEQPELSVLTATNQDGAFVKASQTMAAKEDFRHVSKLWYDKTISFDQGRELMAKQREQREDIEIAVRDVDFTPDDKGIIVTIDGRDFRPTPYALSKLCSWFHTPITIATYYMNPPNNEKYNRDMEDYDLVCLALENGRRRMNPDKELLFRTYKDGTLRSVMSDGYSIIDNDWCLELLSQLIPGGRLSHWRGDADTIYGNIIIPDSIRTETDSDYGGMLSVSNCEIGKRVYGQTPSIFSAICMNGNIWGKTEGIALSQRHKGVNLEDLAERTKTNLLKQIPLMTDKVDELLITRQWKMDTQPVNIFAAVQHMSRIAPSIASDVAQEWIDQGKQFTAFGVIDAITRASQRQSNEDWVAMDVFSSNLLSHKVWENMNYIAKGLDEKQIRKNLNMLSA